MDVSLDLEIKFIRESEFEFWVRGYDPMAREAIEYARKKYRDEKEMGQLVEKWRYKYGWTNSAGAKEGG